VELGASQVEPLALLAWLAKERACKVVVCEDSSKGYGCGAAPAISSPTYPIACN
jgi:hypothetical protein